MATNKDFTSGIWLHNGKVTHINGHQVFDPEITVCFNCSEDGEHYFEFHDTSTFEAEPCPRCGKTDTVPKYYIGEMSIPALQAFLSEMAEQTGVLPLLDYKFKDFIMPGTILCDYKLSEKWTGWTG